MTRKVVFITLALLSFSFINAQVQIYPAPEDGYQNRIKTFIDNLKVIDTHEHLIPQNKLHESTSYDFMLLLAHYSNSDIISSGLPQDLFGKLMKDSLTTEKKWEILKPYWERCFNTAYCRNALYASRNLFGIDSFNDSSVIVLSDRIKEAYKNQDWFYDVLDKGNIEWVIQDGNDRSFRADKFRYVIRFDHFVNIRSRNHIDNLSKRQKIDIRTLDDLLAALDKSFATDISENITGIKTGLAYSRILHYETSM
jgi:hypothetical protein